MDPRQANAGGQGVLNVSNGSNRPSGKPDKMLGTSDFVSLLGTKDESYYIDKTKMVEVVLETGIRLLVTSPRRFGKTVNITMLKAFFELQVPPEECKTLSKENFQIRIKETENYKLFQEHDLVITKNLVVMEKHFGKYPVIDISFKCDEIIQSLDEAIAFCSRTISETFQKHKYLISSAELGPWDRNECTKWCKNEWDRTNLKDYLMIREGLKTLARCLCKHFNKKTVLLIDEYDSVMTKAIQNLEDTKELKNVIQFCTGIIEVAVNENAGEHWIEYAFITGISHIVGHPGSNIRPYRFLENHDFVPYYGLTATEVRQLLQTTYQLDEQRFDEAERKFSGYSTLRGVKIYNTWSVLEYASKAKEDQVTYEWQDAGYIIGLQEAFRFPVLMEMIQTKLLFNEPIKIQRVKCFTVYEVLNLVKIIGKVDPQNNDYSHPDLFFSLLFYQGYLSYVANKPGLLVIPNEQIKEQIKKKLTDCNIKAVGSDHNMLTANCREFFLKISKTKCDHDDFKKFHVNFEALLQKYAATWIKKHKVNLRCTVNILISNLGFKVCGEIGGLEYQGKIDQLIIKDNFVMILETTYKQSNKKAMLYIKEGNYLKIFEAKDVIRDPITHYILMGINMDENGQVAIGYLQDNQNFDAMTLIP